MDIPIVRSRSSSIGGSELLGQTSETKSGISPSLSSQRRPPSSSSPSTLSLNNNQSSNNDNEAPSSSSSYLASSNNLTKRVDVVVMCGSSGSRLFPLTINSPKCLLPICNIPVLYYLLSSLQKLGFVDIILVCE